MACCNYCNKNNYRHLHPLILVTDERALAYSLIKGKERYEVSVETRITGAGVDGKTAETKSQEFYKEIQEHPKEIQHQAIVQVPANYAPTGAAEHPSSVLIHATLAVGVALVKAGQVMNSAKIEPLKLFGDGLEALIKASRINKK